MWRRRVTSRLSISDKFNIIVHSRLYLSNVFHGSSIKIIEIAVLRFSVMSFDPASTLSDISQQWSSSEYQPYILNFSCSLFNDSARSSDTLCTWDANDTMISIGGRGRGLIWCTTVQEFVWSDWGVPQQSQPAYAGRGLNPRLPEFEAVLLPTRLCGSMLSTCFLTYINPLRLKINRIIFKYSARTAQ
jgi:hypothetical protein